MTRAAFALAIGLISTVCPAFAQSPALPDTIGSAACIGCHVDEGAAWTNSDHARTWRAPAPDLVPVGTHGKVRLTQTENGVLLSWPGSIPPRRPEQVTGVIGSGPRHRYLLPADHGELTVAGFSWNADTGDWDAAEQTLPSDDIHTDSKANWNADCARCHATDFAKRYDPVTGTYDSRYSERGVGCEACHGPGEAHAEWAELTENFDHAAWSRVELNGLRSGINGDATVETRTCASCHARGTPITDRSTVPGAPVGDNLALTLLKPGLYFADGQIKGEALTYGAFLQSKEHASGVGCSDCHAPHSATLRAEGNAVCTECHNPAGNARFENLKPAFFDTSEHHFHDEGTEAAQCVSCHMPSRPVWTGIQHDHSFRIPRPADSSASGSPDACTSCHTNRTADWAAQEVQKRLPDQAGRPNAIGPILAHARQDPAATAAALCDIALETDLPGIVRATALDLLRSVQQLTIADRLAPLLRDPDPLVRAAAAGTQQGVEPVERVQRLAPLLGDDIRAVRLAAVQEILAAPKLDLPERLQRKYETAVIALRTSLASQADRAESQLRLGILERQTGNYPKALSALKKAVEMEPENVKGWTLLVQIQADMGQLDQARKSLRSAMKHTPDDPALSKWKERLDP